MKINVKKILALVSSAVISLNLICGSICSAETVVPAYSDSVHTDTDVSVQGTDVFGNMLAAELQSAQDQQLENSGQNIFSVEMTGKIATVEYDVLADCAVVVGIYDESGTTMLASGNADISADSNIVQLTIGIDTMPQYYYIKAFLIDKQTMRPLCSVYENPMYTQEMQEFLAKTTDDFDADKVYNLDEDKTNNFAVYNDEVKVIPDELKVRWKTYSTTTGYYNVVIYSPDEISKSLKEGDVFAYKDVNGNFGIDKVAFIEDCDSFIKVYVMPDDELELEDVFDYVKVDGESLSENCTSTPTGEEDDGVTYLGMTVETPEENVSVGYAAENTYYDEESLEAVNISGSATVSHNFKIEKEFKSSSNNGIGDGTTTLSAKLTASLKFSASASAKVYITLDEHYVEMKLDYAAKLSAEFSGSAKLEVPLCQELGFAVCPGVYVGITPKIIAEVSASIKLEGTLSGTVGFKCDGKSLTNLSTAPKFETKLKVEGKYYLGFSLSPRLKIISKYVASAGMEAQVGVEINVKSDIFQWDSTQLVKHDCSTCITGDISAKLKVGFDITLLNMESLKFSITALEKTWKLFDFYYSNISGFDFGSCPNKSYKTRILVYDNTLNKVNDAVITVDGNVISSGSYEANVYLKKGTHNFKAENPNFRTSNKNEEIKAVSTKANEIMLIMYPKNYSGSGGIANSNQGGSGGSGGSDEPIVDLGIQKNRLSLGWVHSAYILENGDLYIWGGNDYGQIGDNTTIDKITPMKIMSNVAQVSLGWAHSACITTNGDLYMWGDNSDGQLGDSSVTDRYTPVKIMSNVAQASLGTFHSACITTNGDLYTWGYNWYGQLGDGNYHNLHTPVKIMSNVAQVSLRGCHSACITTNGDLYSWGDNDNGQLGDNTTTKRNEPTKIMSNVSQVSLGDNHSACITSNGELYMWGNNSFGQLGDDTTTKRDKPTKIMSNVAQVSLGDNFSACVTTNGNLYTWGYNGGLLGDDTTTRRNTPTKIMSNVAQVILGGSHSACITTTRELYTWGTNSFGQLGDGTTTNSSVPIKITIPDEDEAEDEVEALSASPVQQFTGLLPNEVYNIYSMNSRTADEPFSSDNLLYIDQKMSDSEGNLTVNISTNKSGINPEIFVKAMNGGEINNADITSVKESDGAVSIGWDSIDGADKYTVYTIRNGIFIKETDTSGLSYTVDGLIPGTEYGFIVQAWVNGEYSVLDKSDAVYIILEKELSIEECIDMVNNLLNTSDDEVYLTDEQLKAIERVMAYNKGILS